MNTLKIYLEGLMFSPKSLSGFHVRTILYLLATKILTMYTNKKYQPFTKCFIHEALEGFTGISQIDNILVNSYKPKVELLLLIRHL